MSTLGRLSCKEASQLVSQALDRRLRWHERIRLRLHLLACDACTAFKRQAAFLRRATRVGGERLGEGSRLTLASTTRERIRQTLRRNS